MNSASKDEADWDCEWTTASFPPQRSAAHQAGIDVRELAGLRFRVRVGDPGGGQNFDEPPRRVRIVGTAAELGYCSGFWDPQSGLELHWTGWEWESAVIPCNASSKIRFSVVWMEQPGHQKGNLQGSRRAAICERRGFRWGPLRTLWAPFHGEVLDVLCYESLEHDSSNDPLTETAVVPREDLVVGPRSFLPTSARRGRTTLHTFDNAWGASIHFGLYIPCKFERRRWQERRWPLLIFLHSMYASLSGDNNLFFESDSLLRLLADDPLCPRSLREDFVVLVPQCPPDSETGEVGSIWLRAGFYEESRYDTRAEASLRGLIDWILDACAIDQQRVYLSGASMGGYACLELASRWPGYFAAVAPVAAHYDLDPVEQLVDRLSRPLSTPFWFFHAWNDNCCPFKPISEIVRQLRKRSNAEVKLTVFEDTWSAQGHCADRVAYWAKEACSSDRWCAEGDAQALGDELFAWLLQQVGPGQSPS